MVVAVRMGQCWYLVEFCRFFGSSFRKCRVHRQKARNTHNCAIERAFRESLIILDGKRYGGGITLGYTYTFSTVEIIDSKNKCTVFTLFSVERAVYGIPNRSTLNELQFVLCCAGCWKTQLTLWTHRTVKMAFEQWNEIGTLPVKCKKHAFMVLFTWNWLTVWKAARLAFVSPWCIHRHTLSRFWMIDKFISSKFWPTRETFHLVNWLRKSWCAFC